MDKQSGCLEKLENDLMVGTVFKDSAKRKLSVAGHEKTRWGLRKKSS